MTSVTNIVVAVKNGEINTNGGRYRLAVGDLVNAEHPIAKSHPEYFKPADQKLKYDLDVDRSNPPTDARDATVTPVGPGDVTRGGRNRKRAA